MDWARIMGKQPIKLGLLLGLGLGLGIKLQRPPDHFTVRTLCSPTQRL